MFARRCAAAAVMSLVSALALAGVRTPSATADTHPDPGTPATVSADPLPTWQINGVVWAQVRVGNVVYATGKFTKARPAGVGPGGSGERSAGNIFAYDIRTGQRVSTFSHSLNGQGSAIAASPDGKRVYVGGDFTSVDGKAHYRVAAFDTSTNGLVSGFAPSVNNHVGAIAVGPDDVYLGGSFTRVNGTSRTRLAAVSPTGALRTWAPKADDYRVRTMVLSPNGLSLIVGGSFTTLNGLPAYGMGAVSTSDGTFLPWAANAKLRDAEGQAGITSLRTDGNLVYGSGYVYIGAGSTGNFEGTFAADPTTGEIVWVDDCHGDTYDVAPIGQLLYSVGHSHDCSSVGEFDDAVPKREQRAMVSPITPNTVNRVDTERPAWDCSGLPAAQHLHWFPALTQGSFTGLHQAAWSIVGDTDYIALGGEFTRVNGKAQQGLVRYAVSSLAPNKIGPSSDFAASATSPAPSAVQLSWTSVWDQDNETLDYNVYRDGGATPVYTLTMKSNFWNRPPQTFPDAGVSVGHHTYVIKATDPDGNTSSSGPVGVDVA